MQRTVLLLPLFLLDPCGEPDPTSVEALYVPPLAPVSNGRFATSTECRDCHANFPSAQAMRDEAGRPIAMHDLWSGTMMANASRDPLWRAVVSAEIARTPNAKAAIEDKCLRCHAPMASEDNAITGGAPLKLSILTSQSTQGALALDGVSCTLCHQIDADNLGEPSSFSGGFHVTPRQETHGPHQDPVGAGMEDTSGFAPVFATHTLDSEFCATCHTLFTDTLTAAGTPTGEKMPEQTAYLEWLNSSFSDPTTGQSCQDCHLPTVSEDGLPITTQIARGRNGMDIPNLPARNPYGRHVFVGGNTLVPGMFRDYADTLNPVGTLDELAATLERNRRHLQYETANVSLARAEVTGGALTLDVVVRNLGGHKLPTGIPLRRAWLHVVVRDGDGNLIFESGAADRAGRILGPDGLPLAFEAAGGPIEAHHQRITSMGEVQIYEAVMADSAGKATFTLLRAADYVKDNRLLPLGWDPGATGVATIAPRGVGADTSFTGGSDTVTYTVDVSRGDPPYDVTVEALFQPLSTRAAAELFLTSTPEIDAFEVMYNAADRSPTVLHSVEQRVF